MVRTLGLRLDGREFDFWPPRYQVTDLSECCFGIVAVFGNNVAVLATMSNEISSFWQSRNKLNMFNLFRLRRKNEISFDIVANNGKNGNNVKTTFDFVERNV